MSAERMPQDKPSLAERPLLGLTRLVLRRPVLTLVLGGLLALGATLLSHYRLGFRTNRLDLLNPKSEFNRLWIDYVREFGDQEDVVVVVEGPGREQVVPVRDELAAEIARDAKSFQSVLWSIDPAALRSKGLYYLPAEELEKVGRFLDAAEPIVGGRWSGLNAAWMGGGMCRQLELAGPDPAARGEAQEQLLRFAQGLLHALDGRYQSPWPAMPRDGESPEEADSRQLLTGGGRMGLVLLKLVKNDAKGDFVHGIAAIRALRELIARAQARHPGVKIGLTGLPVIEHDEMQSSQSSMAQVSLVSLIGVSLLFVAGFGGWRHPLLAVLSLTVGTAWAMGYITLSIGHLNILSSAFAVILIGQGIDFSMYYVAHYLQLRATVPSTRDALLQTVAAVGPGVATGAITTAVAFFMAGLTEFTGIAELGIISGGGVLLCWIAGLTLLPAAIHLVDSRWPYLRTPVPVDVRSWLAPLMARPGLVLGAALAVTLVLIWGLRSTTFDHNLLHLQARGLQSVELEQRLLRDCEQNASFALSIADHPAEFRDRKAKFLQLSTVKRVEEIDSKLPGDAAAKQPFVEQISRRLAALCAAMPQGGPPTIPVPRAGELVQVLAGADALMERSPKAAQFRQTAERTIDALRRLPPEVCQPRLAAWQQAVAGEMLGRLQALAAVSNPEPPQLADLPQSLVSRFVSPSGRHLMKIYCKGNVWDMEAMKQFVADVRSVDPRATGNPMQIYEASRQMQRSYEEAALYALAIIVPVVFLDFRNVRLTLLALLPLGLGMAQMFGLMGLIGLPLNPANMIVLPLILGIGIDAGVHVVHDYCSQRGPYRINPSTASAVVINTVTNMAGFGSLMIASHRGLQSLGRVLTLGLTCCLFTSLVMLPAILTLRSRWRFRRGEGQPESEPEAAPSEEPSLGRRAA